MDIIKNLEADLASHVDAKILASYKRFFKEEVHMLGVNNADMKLLIAKYSNLIRALNKIEAFKVFEAMFKTNVYEMQIMACVFSNYFKNDFVAEDAQYFTRWVSEYVSNWAVCDTLCNHTVGNFLMQFPDQISILQNWSRSKNRWMKRAAAVSLIIPARKGMFQKEIFEIADTLLLDQDDMVQKGYGWMLKATSQFDQSAVFNYVMAKKAVMPRTALRYAIEKMPQELRKQAMAK